MTDTELTALIVDASRQSRAWGEVRNAAADILAAHDQLGPAMPPSDTGPIRLRLEKALAAVKPRLTADEMEAVAIVSRLTDAEWLHETDRRAAVAVVKAIRRVAG